MLVFFLEVKEFKEVIAAIAAVKLKDNSFAGLFLEVKEFKEVIAAIAAVKLKDNSFAGLFS